MDRSRTTYFFVLIISGVWCSLFLAAPLLQSVDSSVSSSLYSLFARVCHQFSDRSFHLAGEPLGVCIRCSAVYSGFLVSLMLFPVVRRWNRTPDTTFLALALVPMAIDVGLNLLGLSHSTGWTRAITGSLAGAALPFFVLPPLQEAVHQLAVHFGDSPHAGKTQ